MFKKKKDIPTDPKKEFTCEMTVMILGCSHSGKSTIMHQFQLISDESSIDKKHFQRVIYSNTISTILHLLNIVSKLGLQVSAENKERIDRIKALPVSASEFRLSRFPLKLVYDVKCLWEDEAVKKAYAHTLREPDDAIAGRPEYYMENIFRIFSPDFKPEDQDVLSAYEQVEVTQSAEVVYKRVKIALHSFPGDVTDNRKWDTLNIPPDVLLYTVNLSQYPLFRRNEQAHTNLKAALDSLGHLADNWPPFSTAHSTILVFSYKDIFLEKVKTEDLKQAFPEYEGGSDPQKALEFVTSLFKSKIVGKSPHLRVYTSDALDRGTATTIIDEMMDSLAAELSKRTEAASNTGKLITSSSGLLPPDNRDRKDSVTKTKNKKNKGITRLESGFEAVQGRRKTMEDTHVLLDDFRAQYPSFVQVGGQCGYYGVYDGHGGAETSKQLEQLLHKNILEDPQFASGNYEAGLKAAFETTDKFVVTQPWKSGSTAVVSVIVDNHLFCANAGDSEAVLGRQVGSGKKAKFEHVVLSYKHVPTDEQEKQRITGAGGLVVFGRLFGSLAVSRSFGDKDFKDGAHFVSSEPHIMQIELTPADQFIVMACDGLWDKLTYDDVINSVSRLRKEGKSATEISKALVQEAIDKDSLDNVTAVVVFLQWKK